MSIDKEKARERASKGGHARAASLSSKQRSESARKAVKARWAKVKAEHFVLTETVNSAHTITIGLSNSYTE